MDAPELIAPAPRHDLATTVAEELGTRIVSGLIKPGTALPSQDRLSEELRVSRPVVREAAKILESKGLLQSRPRTGMRVRDRADWHMLDPLLLAWQAKAPAVDLVFITNLLEVRATVEPIAAGLAACRASSDDVARITSSLEALAASAPLAPGESGSRLDFISADVDFHRRVLEASHNELLLQIAAPISEVLKISDRFASRAPGACVASVPLHRAVVDAIQAKDGDAAQRGMRKLVARAAEDVAALLDKRDAVSVRSLAADVERDGWPGGRATAS